MTKSVRPEAPAGMLALRLDRANSGTAHDPGAIAWPSVKRDAGRQAPHAHEAVGRHRFGRADLNRQRDLGRGRGDDGRGDVDL